MMIKLNYVLFAIMLSINTSIAVANDQSYTVKEVINCKNANVYIETTCKKYQEFDTQCTSQKLLIINSNKKITKTLPHDGNLILKFFDTKTKVLDAYITQWACLKSKYGRYYLLLWYDCSLGDEKEYCLGAGNNQWERIFSLEGRDLTAGYPHKGPSLDILYHKLGIYEISEKGIELKPLKWTSE